ncbi:MAG: ATP-dependent Clp protease adaptor ClpS [Roseibacillus sp.]|nr:ATP-dependent Clp protease adaptor ClpS [Roseibacillus sp.]
MNHISPDFSASALTEEETRSSTEVASSWNVLVLDDPVKLMEYVTKVLQKVFAYPREQAEDLMLTIHTAGKALVWTGAREPAELYVQQLHGFQLQASLEKAGS